MTDKKPRATKFRTEWVKMLEAEKWLSQGSCDTKAKCCFCGEFSVGQQGITSVKQHEATSKHQKLSACQPKKQTNIQSFCIPQTAKKESPSIEAEIRWAWHTAEVSKAFYCENDAGDLFKAMFNDSELVKSFTCGRIKQNYLINYAIAQFCRETIVKDVGDSFYSIAFDETDSKMMVIIRYVKSGKVISEMLDLVPLTDLKSKTCAEAILESLDGNLLKRSKCVSDFSDGCNTMRGRHNGVVKRLREQPGLENLLDVGGCSLHVVSNCNRDATQAVFQELADLADDIYIFFKRSAKRSTELLELQKTLGLEQHKFIRYVELRWLVLLPTLERIEEQWDVLTAFMRRNEDRNESFRGKRILRTLNRETRIAIRFVIHAMSLSLPFEKLFQQNSSVLIHKLHDQHVQLLRTICVQFLKTEFLETYDGPLWDIDFANLAYHRSLGDILIGEKTRSLLTKVSDRLIVHSMKSFYIQLATSLSKKLPFHNEILPLLRFMGMPPILRPQHVLEVSKRMPHILPSSESDALITEVNLFNLREKSDPSLVNVADPALAWHNLTSDDCQFPRLCRIALACCTICHGNADAEREISKSHEIDSDPKRNRLSDLTRRNLLIARSFLNSRSLTAATVCIPNTLIEYGLNARAAQIDDQKKREREIQRLEAQKRREEEEKKLQEEIRKDRERLSELKRLEIAKVEADATKAKASQNALEAEMRLQQAIRDLKDANKQCEDALQLQQSLETQKEVIERKALEKASAAALDKAATLKRKSTSEALAKLPKIRKKNDGF